MSLPVSPQNSCAHRSLKGYLEEVPLAEESAMEKFFCNRLDGLAPCLREQAQFRHCCITQLWMYAAALLAHHSPPRKKKRPGSKTAPAEAAYAAREVSGGDSQRSAGLSARSTPLVAISAWYCRPSGTLSASNHSATLGCAQPSALAMADCEPKNWRRSCGVIVRPIIGVPKLKRKTWIKYCLGTPKVQCKTMAGL